MDTNREAVGSCLFVCISGWKSVASVNHLKKSSRAATIFAYSVADSTDAREKADLPANHPPRPAGTNRRERIRASLFLRHSDFVIFSHRCYPYNPWFLMLVRIHG